jgi:hypothetical protein
VGSALPKLDVSVTDHRWDCLACQYRHAPGAECPEPGRWLGSDLLAPEPKRASRKDGVA